MTFFYSATTGGFYSDAVHAARPDDCVEITTEQHAAYLDAQAEGMQIVAGSDGRPETIDPMVDPARRRTSLLASIKREAERRILGVSPIWKQLNDMRADDAEARQRFVVIDAIRSVSNEIEHALAACPDADLADFDVRGNAAWPAGPNS